MDDYIFKPLDSNPKPSEEVGSEGTRGVVAYSALLKEVGEDSVDAYAKVITSGNKASYYVKQDKYGNLFNPQGMYQEGTQRKQMRHAGRPRWVFIKVDQKIYDLYIKFLETKNEAWLHNAEREMM